MTKDLILTPHRIASFFAFIVGLLLTANLVFIFMEHTLGLSFHSIHIFYFNNEANLPAVYSSVSMLFVAVMLWITGNLKTDECRRGKKYWRLLSVVFFFLSVDELVSFHESLTDNAKNFLSGYADAGNGLLYFAWIVPYVVFFGVLFILMIRFLLTLPPRTLLRFMLAGATFVIGAVGMEMVGGRYIYLHGDHGKNHLTYALMVTVEEVLEMGGVIIFIYALTGYYIQNSPDRIITIHIGLSQDLKCEKPLTQTSLNPVQAETGKRVV